MVRTLSTTDDRSGLDGAGGERTLGRTGVPVDPVSLGGEGVLRTSGRTEDAVAVIREALRVGVRYCDTAPAYDQSQDYYGEAFRRAGAGARDRVFLASKTHARDKGGALRLLEQSLRRIGTDRLDLWQMHDLRTKGDLDRIFGEGGAIEAAEEARADGRIRFVGLTGHHDPEILLEAMRRYRFDTVLVALNPADARRLPFITTVVAEARRQGMGIIAMKVLAAGRLVADGAASVKDLVRFSSSLADTSIIGCSSPAEVRECLAQNEAFEPMDEGERAALVARLAPFAARYDTFKRPERGRS